MLSSQHSHKINKIRDLISNSYNELIEGLTENCRKSYFPNFTGETKNITFFQLYFNFGFFKQILMLYFFMHIASLYINMMTNSGVERFLTYDSFANDLWNIVLFHIVENCRNLR